MIQNLLPSSLLGLSLVIGLAGCAEDAPQPGSGPSQTGGQADATPKSNPEVAARIEEIMAKVDPEQSAEIEKELAKLSPEDRQLAETQQICFVGKKPLGSMEGMTKVTIDGQDVFVCCAGCISELEDNPEKYADELAHLKAIRLGGGGASNSEPVAAPQPSDKEGAE